MDITALHWAPPPHGVGPCGHLSGSPGGEGWCRCCPLCHVRQPSGDNPSQLLSQSSCWGCSSPTWHCSCFLMTWSPSHISGPHTSSMSWRRGFYQHVKKVWKENTQVTPAGTARLQRAQILFEFTHNWALCSILIWNFFLWFYKDCSNSLSHLLSHCCWSKRLLEKQVQFPLLFSQQNM